MQLNSRKRRRGLKLWIWPSLRLSPLLHQDNQDDQDAQRNSCILVAVGGQEGPRRGRPTQWISSGNACWPALSSTFWDRPNRSVVTEELGRVDGFSDGGGRQDLLGFPVGLQVSSESQYSPFGSRYPAIRAASSGWGRFPRRAEAGEGQNRWLQGIRALYRPVPWRRSLFKGNCQLVARHQHPSRGGRQTRAVHC